MPQSITTVSVLTFSYIYEKIYKQMCFSLHSSNQKKAIEKFEQMIVKKYKDSAGPEFVWRYCLFQFGRYIESIEKNTLKIPGGKITPTIIFSARALEVFESRNTKMDFLILKNDLVKKYKVSKEELIFLKGVEFLSEKQNFGTQKKDPIKAIAIQSQDKEMILQTCLDMTDLYNHQDPSCKRCPVVDECKKAMKRLYPKIYMERKYE